MKRDTRAAPIRSDEPIGFTGDQDPTSSTRSEPPAERRIVSTLARAEPAPGPRGLFRRIRP